MTDTESNPLIADREDSTEWYSGVSLVESVVGVKDAIESGSWIAAGLGVLGAGLEVAAVVIDPFGTLAGFGVGFLMEHVEPLSDALDWVAGDPDQVAAYAKTWENVATALTETFDSHKLAVERDLAHWSGATAVAYKARAAETSDALAAAVTAANTASQAIGTAGGIVAAVRSTIRVDGSELYRSDVEMLGRSSAIQFDPRVSGSRMRPMRFGQGLKNCLWSCGRPVQGRWARMSTGRPSGSWAVIVHWVGSVSIGPAGSPAPMIRSRTSHSWA